MAILNGRTIVSAVVVALWLGVAAPVVRPAAESEYAVKAAFLLNFTKFVQWPASTFESASAPFRICVLGADPFGGALDEVAQGESVAGRRVEVQRLQKPPAPKACQILFVSASEKDVRTALTAIGPGVLTVGETPGFLGDGGIIAFILENRRVRFDIDAAAAAAAGLSVSSRLLTVARSVRK
jgi:hypothetical protein